MDVETQQWSLQRVVQAYPDEWQGSSAVHFDSVGQRIVTTLYNHIEELAWKIWDATTGLHRPCMPVLPNEDQATSFTPPNLHHTELAT